MQQQIWRAPDVVIVHLKRFSIDAQNIRSRLSTLVEVPLGVVDFSPYFAPNSPFKDHNNKFRLFAVSNHAGRWALELCRICASNANTCAGHLLDTIMRTVDPTTAGRARCNCRIRSATGAASPPHMTAAGRDSKNEDDSCKG